MYRIAKSIGLLMLAGALNASVKLPALISDHMVLQQGAPVRVWGSADPNEAVKVDFQGQSVTVKAAENGKWVAWLKPLVAGGPLEMTINDTVVKDVLVGEVWLGSGQSNMEFKLQTADHHDEEIAGANYPMMHLFLVKKAVAEQPAEDVVGTWQVCAPDSAKGFSAVEYFFGRHLYGQSARANGADRERLGRHAGANRGSHGGSGSRPRTEVRDRRTGTRRWRIIRRRRRATISSSPRGRRPSEDAKAAGKNPPNRPAVASGAGSSEYAGRIV